MKSTFVFVGYDEKSPGNITFYYRLSHNASVYTFQEKIILPGTQNSTPKSLLNNLLLMLGISYWKTFCPGEIVITPFTLTKKQAEFWNLVYTKGLGEFYFKNKIDDRDLVHFPYDDQTERNPISIITSNTSLVLLGGGKDSIVTAELLKQRKKQFVLFAVNPVDLQDEIARTIGGEYIRIQRVLDPQLFKLNTSKDVYNGHVPISAVWAFLALLTAARRGFGSIVTSNEASSNYGNVKYLGREINHQWSKSLEFEQAFSSYIRTYITPDINYFSQLRSMSEVDIAKIFVRYPEYFSKFSSCNQNFSITDPLKGSLWCGKCAKCAFVFLLLSALIPREQVVNIFRKNLLDDSTLLRTYEELLGVAGHKPFECVGTPQESLWALKQVRARGEFQQDSVIKKLHAI